MPAMFKLDHAGIREILNSDWMQREVNAAAETIAKEVRARSGDMAVEVTEYKKRTDRDGAVVTVADPRGQAEQAKNGILTGGAAAAGFEVKAK